MRICKEILKKLHQEDVKFEKEYNIPKDKHYSQKPGHKERSIANNPRKKSKRR
ncbi:hypothetical protein KKD03_00825 [Patescibacteria group bacterium]|nr:hypothetical protein [Patescibacteria group bacterium]